MSSTELTLYHTTSESIRKQLPTSRRKVFKETMELLLKPTSLEFLKKEKLFKRQT